MATTFEDKICKIKMTKWSDDILSVAHRRDQTYLTVLDHNSKVVTYQVNRKGIYAAFKDYFAFELKPQPWDQADVQGKEFLYRRKDIKNTNFISFKPNDLVHSMWLDTAFESCEWSHSVKGPWYPCDKYHVPS